MANFFKDIEDLQDVFPQTHASADDVLKYVSDAEELYMVDYLSSAFYGEVLAALDTANYVLTDLTPQQQAIIDHLRSSSAYYGLYEAMPFINVHLSNTGAMAHNGNESTQLRQWEYKEARGNAINKADRFLDKALAIMEATPADYATWQASTAFTIHKKYFITNAEDFRTKGLVDINDSRRTYLKLIPFIAKAELQFITDCIGETLFDGIKSKLIAGTSLSAEEQILMDEYIFPATAHYALYLGAPNLKLDISQNGIRLVSTNDGITGITPEERAYKEWRHELLGDAKDYLSRAKKYLDDNSDVITDYSSDPAAENDTPQYEIPDNSTSSSSVML